MVATLCAASSQATAPVQGRHVAAGCMGCILHALMLMALQQTNATVHDTAAYSTIHPNARPVGAVTSLGSSGSPRTGRT